MEEDQTNGGGYPSIPRPLRGQRRSALTGAEICAGITGSKMARICVWPRVPICRKRLWQILEHLPIIYIGRIKQRGMPLRRYDVFVRRKHGKKVLKFMKRVRQEFDWHVKRHSSYSIRRRRRLRMPIEAENGEQLMTEEPDEQPASELDEGENLENRKIRIATWNVNSIGSKRKEIDMYLKRCKIKILGVQETWRNIDGWPIRLRDYRVFEALSQQGEGRNGLATFVSNEYPAVEVENGSPYTVIVRVRLGITDYSIINIYIPHQTEARKTALKDLKRGIQNEYNSNLDARILVMGDWNMEQVRVQKLLQKWRLPVQVTRCLGNPATFRRGNTLSSLDHIITSNCLESHIKKCKVNRNWDLSDHWPVQLTLRFNVREGTQEHVEDLPASRINLDTVLLQNKGNEVRDDNRWAVLAELLETSDNDEGIDIDVALSLQNTLRDISEDLEIAKQPRRNRKRKYCLSKKARRAVDRRRKFYKEWIASGDLSQMSAAYIRYENAKKDAKAIIRECNNISWLRFIEAGSSKLSDNDMGGFWNWAKQITGRGKNGPADYGPLRVLNQQTELAYSTLEKLEVWRQHYQTLFNDVTGHSQDESYWREVLPGEPGELNLDCNSDFSWMELNHVLRKMKNGKAPGCDGIPPEFFKLARTRIDEVAPSSPLGTLLLRLANWIWHRGHIPESWREAHVVSIYKKGDPKDPDNYRGISLIPVGLKLVTSLVYNRLRECLETSNWFIPQQAGFRPREECAGHICSLYEILRRRQIENKNTFVAFIDIQKAYDTVPIAALMRKLTLLGLHGNMLRFFKELYNAPKIRVRTKEGVSGLIEQKRGLRQGCNASPLLFDIFINDILEECAQYGVSIMGLPEGDREVGLLFADDLVVMADTQENLIRVLTAIQRWGDKFEMRFGVKKCGIMGFGADAIEAVRDMADQWLLDGQIIPVVSEYTYLGVPIRSPIDLEAIVEDRAQKGRRCLQGIRPVLACVSIPLNIRIRLVKALLVPVLTYASELWGCNAQRAQPCQTVLSEAVRYLIRLRPKTTITSFAALSLEFNIPSIHAMASSARVRAFIKFPTLSTVIGKLLQFPIRARQRTWGSSTSIWLKRQHRNGLLDCADDRLPTAIRDLISSREAGQRLGALNYLEYEFTSSQSYIHTATRYVSYSRGVHYLCKFRVGAIWTASRLATIGFLPPLYTQQCPFCNSGVPETYEHILVHCEAWSEHRVQMITKMGTDHIILLGGRRISEEQGQTPVSNEWLDSSTQSDLATSQSSQDEAQLPGFIMVADFLQRICPIRFRILANLMRVPRADATNIGMASPSDVFIGDEMTNLITDDVVDIRWDDTIS